MPAKAIKIRPNDGTRDRQSFHRIDKRVVVAHGLPEAEYVLAAWRGVDVVTVAQVDFERDKGASLRTDVKYPLVSIQITKVVYEVVHMPKKKTLEWECRSLHGGCRAPEDKIGGDKRAKGRHRQGRSRKFEREPWITVDQE
ncbi:MAG: hypothetical protein LLG20_11425 [Acidobacteriales bacterium]|nr:hypothetical protein [Terriglobales bacterium]